MTEFPKEGKRTIKLGEGNTIGIIRPLIPFNCIVDTDVGLIDLIKNEYRSSDMFNIGLLDSFINKKDLIKYLYHRSTFNPIVPFMNNKEDIETADDLYNQFINKRYNDILNRSPVTGLYKLVSLLNYSNELAPMITYSNQIEYDIIEHNSTLNKIKNIIIDDIAIQDLKLNVFYFKSVIDTYFRKCIPILLSKNIIILDYDYNFDEDGNIKMNDYTIAIEMTRCRVNVINAYNKQEIG